MGPNRNRGKKTYVLSSCTVLRNMKRYDSDDIPRALIWGSRDWKREVVGGKQGE
jgi:hypothetical protein